MKSKLINYIKENTVFFILIISSFILLFIPLPAFMVDILIAVNIVLTLILLIMILLTEDIFSLFPTLVLILTIFNLAVNILANRLIMAKGAELDGWLIKNISSFFAGLGKGGLIINFMIFILSIACECIVVVKGCTRVSEVACRFTLDAFQVKLMAIETEYSCGAITEEEAYEKKKEAQKELDFFGRLDGVSKIISGNERIKLIIIITCILGIIPIGVFLIGESINDVFKIYLPLIIGSGILCMIPSLILSLTIGINISRLVNKYNILCASNKDEK